MRKQAVLALLATAWLFSTKMTVAQPLASWLPDQQDNTAMAGLPLPSPPEDKFDQPDYETPEPASPAPEPETAVPTSHHQRSSPAVPPRTINNIATAWTTMLVLGDSVVDPGNNRLQTAAKANFLPYGTSFYGGNPTGRFSNGRLITNILAEKLGIGRTIPGFLDPKLKPEQHITGVSFASAGSGYDDATAQRSNVLSFPSQLEDLWRYKRNLEKLVRPRRAEQLIRNATFVISAGTTDLPFRYLPSNQSAEDTQLQYENQLIAHVTNYTQVIKKLGGRRFIFVGVPPTGAEKCHGNMNSLATSYTRAAFIDMYTIIAKATMDPNSFGLTETSKGCCGTGAIEVGQTCRDQKTCTDPSKYLFWDAVHQTERINQIIIDDVLMNSIGDIYV